MSNHEDRKAALATSLMQDTNNQAFHAAKGNQLSHWAKTALRNAWDYITQPIMPEEAIRATNSRDYDNTHNGPIQMRFPFHPNEFGKR